MKNMKIGDNYTIHCYKHDGKIHRTWDEAMLLAVHKDYLVFGNKRAKVNNSDGRVWYTKEPAIIYYYKNKWYNVIGQLKHDGIYYYCNMASPFILEDGAIKYIDYDLDLKVFHDYKYKVLDEEEYELHKKLMGYPEVLDKILKEQLEDLISMTYNMSGPFRPGFAQNWYAKYQDILEKGR